MTELMLIFLGMLACLLLGMAAGWQLYKTVAPPKVIEKYVAQPREHGRYVKSEKSNLDKPHDGIADGIVAFVCGLGMWSARVVVDESAAVLPIFQTSNECIEHLEQRGCKNIRFGKDLP